MHRRAVLKSVASSSAIEGIRTPPPKTTALLLTRVAADKALPFSVKVPNARTRKAILELEQGKGKRSKSATVLLKDLGL
ncbi:MAG: type II toxin-antitoxin system RelB/DinJ family antitoxin [Acidiferrobacteraceae bacterium]